MNTGNRFLKEGASLQDVVISAEDKKRNRNKLITGLAVLTIILIAVFAFIGSGDVNASLEPDGLQVKAPLVVERITYGEIASVELRDHFENGLRVGGFGGTKISSGGSENDELGHYTLARYNHVERCIIIHHSGGVLIFNQDTAEGTTSIYDEVRTRI